MHTLKKKKFIIPFHKLESLQNETLLFEYIILHSLSVSEFYCLNVIASNYTIYSSAVHALSSPLSYFSPSVWSETTEH